MPFSTLCLYKIWLSQLGYATCVLVFKIMLQYGASCTIRYNFNAYMCCIEIVAFMCVDLRNHSAASFRPLRESSQSVVAKNTRWSLRDDRSQRELRVRRSRPMTTLTLFVTISSKLQKESKFQIQTVCSRLYQNEM